MRLARLVIFQLGSKGSGEGAVRLAGRLMVWLHGRMARQPCRLRTAIWALNAISAEGKIAVMHAYCLSPFDRFACLSRYQFCTRSKMSAGQALSASAPSPNPG
jgi:hypothetical protein